MNKIHTEDRRKFIRLKAYHLAKYKSLSSKDSHQKPTLASIKDIGAGGICLRTKEAIPVATVIELQIKFPALDTPISTVAKIVWIKQLKKYKIYEVGAQFIEIAESARKLIDEQAKIINEQIKKDEKESVGLFGRLFTLKKK